MRTPLLPDPAGRPSSSRRPAASSDHATGSSLVPLRSANPDDAPTVITASRGGAASDPSLGLFVGSRLGHFELIGTVGSGGMAAVLKARDLELGREVALKILPPQTARDGEAVSRFKQEARAAARLDHENIARVFFCGEDQGLHFIAFEFVEGETLRQQIDRRGPLPPAECVRDMIQVAAGLAHAAERGVVHRDVKPSNIIITPDGRAKIVDMGLARDLAQAVDGGITQSGITLGTFDYISPEQALDPRRADVRSDIYSLGCAFYHALTGRPPVPEGTPAKKIVAHQHEPVLDPRVLNPLVPDELAAVLAKMMAKDPARRYQTPAELIAALTVLARRLNVGTDAFAALDPSLALANPSAASVLPQPPRVPIGLIAGVAALAVAAVILFGLSTSPTRLTDPPPRDNQPAATRTAADSAATTPVVDGNPRLLSGTQTARTTDELIRLLRSPEVTQIKLDGSRYDLSADLTGVVVDHPGRRLTIVGKPGKDAPILRVAAAPPCDPARLASRAQSLTIAHAQAVAFRGVRFEVIDLPGEPTAERPVGVCVSDVGRLDLIECQFGADRGTASDVAGLAVSRAATDSPTVVSIQNCYFGLRHGVGVQLTGRVQAEVAESAFTPHRSAFALRGGAEPVAEPATLSLTHCSFLLDRGAVAETDAAARWNLSAGYCVFAGLPPDPTGDAIMWTDQPDRRPALVRLIGEATDTTASRFRGDPEKPNAYYRIDPAGDEKPIVLTRSPWEADDLFAALNGVEPWRAFRLKQDVPQLQLEKPEVLPGVRFLPRRPGDIYAAWPPLQTQPAADPHVKVWWPKPPPGLNGKLPENHYTNLGTAVEELKPGDELQIRHDGVIEVPQIKLEKPKLRVTVRPYPRSRPILTADPANLFYDGSLFRLSEGQLTLDGLVIRLKSRPVKPDNAKSLAVVTLVAGRECVLRNCVVTVDGQTEEKLAAVVLTDPAGAEMMQRPEDGTGPKVRFENCLIRGKGRAVWVQSARPFELRMDNSVTALAGPVVEIDAASKAPPPATATIRFTQLTAALAGPLLDLAPRPAPGGRTAWVPVTVEAERCLFTPVEPGHPLVALDGGDPMTPTDAVTFAASRTNWYANFPATATFMDLLPTNEMLEPKSLDADGWFTFTGEKADQSIGRVIFETPLPSAKKLGAIKPADLAVRMGFPGGGTAGADVTKVAKPASE